MPGAGSSTVAWAPEQSYLGGTADTPTYRLPGTNVQPNTVELSRNLVEIVAPDDVEVQKYLATQLEGQLDISFVLKNDEFHRMVFNDNYTGFTSGLVNSAEWYLGVDYRSGTTERQIKGWAPATATIEYAGPDTPVRVTLSGPYGDEETNTTITPGTIDDPGDEVPGHGTSLTIDGTSFDDRLQSAALSFEGLSELIRGASQTPIEATARVPSESVEIEHIYDGPELYEQILGTSGATSTQESVDAVTGSLSFSADATTRADYSFDRIKPDTYDWQDLANGDADLKENVTLLASGITASDPTV